MITLLLTVTLVISVWAFCSLAEASLYAVRMPYIRTLEQSQADAGKTLAGFKQNMERPISAILIINTAVAAAGASIAGGQASAMWGQNNLWIFSLSFTLAALFLSEILPKVLGVAYNRTIAPLLARPLSLAITALHPVIWLIERVSGKITRWAPVAVAPEEEVQGMAEISAEEGSIMPYEAKLVRNVLDLDKVMAGQIMTPRSVVTRLPGNLKLGELARTTQQWPFSRIPLFDDAYPNQWTGYVLSRDVLAAIARDEFDVTLGSLAKPLTFVSEKAPSHRLLAAFLKLRTHIFGVVNVSGEVVGIVTLEDVLESLIGAEIVDELDVVVDMRKLAASKSTESK